MSLSQTLTKNIETVVEKVVNSFICTVAEKYSIDEKELLLLWSDVSENKKVAVIKPKKQPSVSDVDTEDISAERLLKCNKAELTALCKANSKKCTGTKEALISRLLGTEEVKAAPPAKEKNSKASRKAASTDIVKKLTANIPAIPIRRNTHGNLEHPATQLVFDKKTELVVGRQQDDGTVAELTDEDIETCKQYKFRYGTPENLDKKEDLDKVKIDELEDDDIVVQEDSEVDLEEQVEASAEDSDENVEDQN